MPLPPLAKVVSGGLQGPRSSTSVCPVLPDPHLASLPLRRPWGLGSQPCPCFHLRKEQPDPDPDPPAVLCLPPVPGPASPRLIPSRLLHALCARTNGAPVSSPDFSLNSRPTYRCSVNSASSSSTRQGQSTCVKPGAGLFPSSLREAALSFHIQNSSINELQ